MNVVALVCGIGLALAFPRASVAPLAWVAPAPWIALLIGVRAGRGFRSGYVFGLGFFGLLLNWVHDVLAHYTSLPLLLTAPIWLLLVGYLALYPAVFGAAVAALGRRAGLGALALAPVLWVGMESARARLLSGFPWGSAGYARAGGLPLLQAASVGGVALVSLVLAAAWAALAVWLLALTPDRWVRFVLATRARPTGSPEPSGSEGMRVQVHRGVPGPRPDGPPASGSDVLPERTRLPLPRARWQTPGTSLHPPRMPPRPGGRALAVASAVLALVAAVPAIGALRLRAHPPVGRAWLLAPESSAGRAEDGPGPPHEDPDAGSASGADEPPAPGVFRFVLVQGGFGGDLDYEQGKAALETYLDLSRRAGREWPALIVWPESNAPFQPLETAGYLDLLRGLSRSTGAVLILGAVAGTERAGLTNSAYLIGPDESPSRYDKRRLVPYGEFVPFQRLFPFVRHFVAEAGEFRPGRDAGVFQVADRSIGVSICYEMIFPEEILAQARRGAEIAINLTNDSWYSRGGPWQHADFSVVRAIETGLHAARAASTGRTMLVDPFGRILGGGALGGRALLVGEIPPRDRFSGPTAFTRLGDWAGISCGILTAAAVAFLVVGNSIDTRRARVRRDRRTRGRPGQ